MYFTRLDGKKTVLPHLYDLHGNMFLWSSDCMQWLGQFDVTTCLASSFGSNHAIITRRCSLPFPTPRVPSQVGRDKPTLPGICCNVALNRNFRTFGWSLRRFVYLHIPNWHLWRIGTKFASKHLVMFRRVIALIHFVGRSNLGHAFSYSHLKPFSSLFCDFLFSAWDSEIIASVFKACYWSPSHPCFLVPEISTLDIWTIVSGDSQGKSWEQPWGCGRILITWHGTNFHL